MLIMKGKFLFTFSVLGEKVGRALEELLRNIKHIIFFVLFDLPESADQSICEKTGKKV